MKIFKPSKVRTIKFAAFSLFMSIGVLYFIYNDLANWQADGRLDIGTMLAIPGLILFQICFILFAFAFFSGKPKIVLTEAGITLEGIGRNLNASWDSMGQFRSDGHLVTAPITGPNAHAVLVKKGKLLLPSGLMTGSKEELVSALNQYRAGVLNQKQSQTDNEDC